jgi:trehalose synthase-fused probable maltokinase
MSDLDAPVREVARLLIERRGNLLEQSRCFDDLLGYPVIRVHGDYHLGQVLRDANGQAYVVDFEGEPQRSVAERTLKTSPLKDVAGMLRSFSYARGAALGDKREARQVDLTAWEQRQRQRFLDGYLSRVRSERPDLLPAGDAATARAIEAWEVDKALYEVLYELSSRPSWLWLPLTSLARIL